MKTNQFQVLLYGLNLDALQIQVGVKGFSDFFHNLTPKHQEKAKLIIFLDEANTNIDVFKKHVDAYEIKHNIVFENFSAKGMSEYFLTSNMLVLMNDKNIQKVLTLSFETSLPIIAVSTMYLKRLIDYSCGILIDENMGDEFANELGHYLEMLYHDPDGRDVLKRGMRSKSLSI